MKSIAAIAAAVILLSPATLVQAEETSVACLEKFALTEETASGFARIALHCVHRSSPTRRGM